MREIVEVLVFVIIGIILIWVGYALFFRMGIPAFGGVRGFRLGKRRANKNERGGKAGDPQICPVCAGKLDSGQLVSSLAFPSLNGGNDRFMHIRGCSDCLRGKRERICPVCNKVLKGEEILICRLFERTLRKPHVHVLGCTTCKGPPSKR
ncbi:MAG: hypothetical protein LBG93_06785 [Treponema sp.]|jgi:hypothetical protein|nr:hypothetical protein [Treponema sp.]